jgi:hypothetical protein
MLVGIEPKILVMEDIIEIVQNLNEKVLAQIEAVQAVVDSLANYAVGLKEKNRPISVFLFIDPTGVSKTELEEDRVIVRLISKSTQKAIIKKKITFSHFHLFV